LTQRVNLVELTGQFRYLIGPNPMRGRKKSEATRLAILSRAAQVFSERPFHQVLTDEISARLNVGKGTLYRYFTSKEDLYFATIVHGLEGMQEAIDRVLGQKAPLERTIESLATTIIGYFWERRDFFVLLHRHETKFEPGERAEWQRGREEVVQRVTARLEREMRGSMDARMAAEMLFGMIRSVCLYRKDSDRVEDLARLVTTVFLRGVAPAPRLQPSTRVPSVRRPATR
jgi:AcrR family transcriptional regulator